MKHKMDELYYTICEKKTADPKHCEVCKKVVGDLIAKVKEMPKKQQKDKNKIEKIIAKYCYLLSTTFSSFYEHVQVNSAETPELKNSRLCLIHAYRRTLTNALSLLGITTPERM